VAGGNASAPTPAVQSNLLLSATETRQPDQAPPRLEAAHSAAETAEQHWQTVTATHQVNVLEHLGALPTDTFKVSAHVTTEASQVEESRQASPPETSFAQTHSLTPMKGEIRSLKNNSSVVKRDTALSTSVNYLRSHQEANRTLIFLC